MPAKFTSRLAFAMAILLIIFVVKVNAILIQ